MKRKISILLALMMAVCMVGAVQITAYAATTAKSVSLSTTTYTYDGKVKKPKVTAKDKKGKFKDSKGAAGTADDAGAFELIMQKKETLISFPDGKDADKDVSFVFSHSALKEGWDNPNVFQICNFSRSDTERWRRQTIGRGLRLCVNQNGDRVRGFEANTLTVIATERYEDFAANFQREMEDPKDGIGIKFGVVESHVFAGILSAKDRAPALSRRDTERKRQSRDEKEA